MTVKDLIEHLQTLPQEMEVFTVEYYKGRDDWIYPDKTEHYPEVRTIYKNKGANKTDPVVGRCRDYREWLFEQYDDAEENTVLILGE